MIQFFPLFWSRLFLLTCCTFILQDSAFADQGSQELSSLWQQYKQNYILDGRVVNLDEDRITTSEGQSYAMLRAVWSDDPITFKAVWGWTRQNLRVRGDALFAWKWKDRVLDPHMATDADSDIALALLMASKRFSEPGYQEEALRVLDDLWKETVVESKGQYFITAGEWAPGEHFPTIHVAYLAPYAYEIFANVDYRHDWRKLVQSSYRILHWIYFEQKLQLPPEVIYLDRSSGGFFLTSPTASSAPKMGYDSVPIFWRIAFDAVLFKRDEAALRNRMLEFFQTEWNKSPSYRRIFEQYSLDGTPLSKFEGLPFYPTLHALANVSSPMLAKEIAQGKLSPLWKNALQNRETNYYLQNWLWFGRALELNVIRIDGDLTRATPVIEFIKKHLVWFLFALTLGCFPLARRFLIFRAVFIAGASGFCLRYICWRFFNTLNFSEWSGVAASLSLWLAECYTFSMALLLLVQVGFRGKKPEPKPDASGFEPNVDIMIPIYSEPLDILEKTLIAARGIQYFNKRVHVLDDGHRPEVAKMALRYGASYIKGPKSHAKAGNLNNALSKTVGELVVVFDTDHIPVTTFLEETVPFFIDPKMGFVQTPHHFYNEDIFQRAFRMGSRIPNEQDMFNHGIQSGRQHWNGAFFVGSGAIFRRAAIEQVGGFKLMSITEDIHTSQHLHAKGWRSAFVDKDLVVGLAAENLASYIVQRRRWMLGCLQIFFKDNPLFLRGLGFRQRIGYFASLYYFFFPLPRIVFWATPVCFLLFHSRPILAEPMTLLTYLAPHLVLLTMMSSIILPGWPRLIWGSVYEAPVSFPLFRAMFDLFLPKSLGFKVTPKGIVSTKRSFDFSSSKLTLIAAAISSIAIAKGIIDFRGSGQLWDAYFGNIAWAVLNLIFLGVGFLIAWEYPQRRSEERIGKKMHFRLMDGERILAGVSRDISMTGMAFMRELNGGTQPFVAATEVELLSSKNMRFPVKCLHFKERHQGLMECVIEFGELNSNQREYLVMNVFADPETWSHAHNEHSSSNWVMMGLFYLGFFKAFLAYRSDARMQLIPRKEKPADSAEDLLDEVRSA